MGEKPSEETFCT